MVAIDERFRKQWEKERERYEVAELELLVLWLLVLCGGCEGSGAERDEERSGLTVRTPGRYPRAM